MACAKKQSNLFERPYKSYKKDKVHSLQHIKRSAELFSSLCSHTYSKVEHLQNRSALKETEGVKSKVLENFEDLLVSVLSSKTSFLALIVRKLYL